MSQQGSRTARARTAAQSKFDKARKRDAAVLKDIEREQQKLAAKTERLRALRLAKEAADKAAAEKEAAAKTAAKIVAKRKPATVRS
jgi:hypothetical protein